MRRFVKRSLSRVAPASRGDGLRILLYHSTDRPVADDTLALRVLPETFRAQMEWLVASGRRPVPLSFGTVATTAGVAITFDDGYGDQLEHAVPVLARLGIPATFFLATRFLDGSRGGDRYWDAWPHLSWREAAALVRAGVEIGSHSVSHAVLVGLAPVRLAAEVRDSRRALEDRLGIAVTSFSYPHGVHDAAARRAVEDAGYALACSGSAGLNRAPVRRFALRRTEIDGRDTLADFRRKLDGRYDWRGVWQRWCGRA